MQSPDRFYVKTYALVLMVQKDVPKPYPKVWTSSFQKEEVEKEIQITPLDSMYAFGHLSSCIVLPEKLDTSSICRWQGVVSFIKSKCIIRWPLMKRVSLEVWMQNLDPKNYILMSDHINNLEALPQEALQAGRIVSYEDVTITLMSHLPDKT